MSKVDKYQIALLGATQSGKSAIACQVRINDPSHKPSSLLIRGLTHIYSFATTTSLRSSNQRSAMMIIANKDLSTVGPV